MVTISSAFIGIGLLFFGCGDEAVSMEKEIEEEKDSTTEDEVFRCTATKISKTI